VLTDCLKPHKPTDPTSRVEKATSQIGKLLSMFTCKVH